MKCIYGPQQLMMNILTQSARGSGSVECRVHKSPLTINQALCGMYLDSVFS